MTTTMRMLPVRTTNALRGLIDQVGPVNPATRALFILGADAAGLDLRGVERELAALLAADLHAEVRQALAAIYARLMGSVEYQERLPASVERQEQPLKPVMAAVPPGPIEEAAPPAPRTSTTASAGIGSPFMVVISVRIFRGPTYIAAFSTANLWMLILPRQTFPEPS